MNFFKKVQNIVRFTIVILVQISQKYLIFEHYSVIWMYFFPETRKSIYYRDFGPNKSKIPFFWTSLYYKFEELFQKNTKCTWIQYRDFDINKSKIPVFRYTIHLMYFFRKLQNIAIYHSDFVSNNSKIPIFWDLLLLCKFEVILQKPTNIGRYTIVILEQKRRK